MEKCKPEWLEDSVQAVLSDDYDDQSWEYQWIFASCFFLKKEIKMFYALNLVVSSITISSVPQ